MPEIVNDIIMKDAARNDPEVAKLLAQAKNDSRTSPAAPTPDEPVEQPKRKKTERIQGIISGANIDVRTSETLEQVQALVVPKDEEIPDKVNSIDAITRKQIDPTKYNNREIATMVESEPLTLEELEWMAETEKAGQNRSTVLQSIRKAISKLKGIARNNRRR